MKLHINEKLSDAALGPSCVFVFFGGVREFVKNSARGPGYESWNILGRCSAKL